MGMGMIGRVVSIDAHWVYVSLERPASCEGCTSCGGMVTEDQKQATRKVQALPGSEPVAVGDFVELEAADGVGSLASLVLFGVPMGGFFAGLILAPPLLIPFGFPSGEGGALLAGLAGLGTSLLLLGILDRTGLLRSLSLRVVARHPQPPCGESRPPAAPQNPP